MRDKYPYLRDPRALAEIRKHKWIESQKKGEEISFAVSALDWIRKYGEEWKQIHGEEYKDNCVFIERRKCRRFKLNTFIKLAKKDIFLLADALNVSFFGLLCRAKEYLEIGSEVDIYIKSTQNNKKDLLCRGVIERVLSVYPNVYEIFLRFDDHSQQKVASWEYIRDIQTLA